MLVGADWSRHFFSQVVDEIIISEESRELEPYLEIMYSRISHFEGRKTFSTRTYVWQSSFDGVKHVIESIEGTSVQTAEEKEEGGK